MIDLTSISRKLSVRGWLLLLTLSVLLPSLLGFGWQAYREARDAREDAYAEIRALALDTANHLNEVMSENRQVLGRLAARRQVRALDAKRCDPLLRDYISIHPEFLTLAVRDREARLLCTLIANPPPAEQIKTNPWFQKVMRSGKFTVSDAAKRSPSGPWVSVTAYPVRDRGGSVSGTIFFSIDLLKLNEQLRQRLKVHHSDSRVTVIDGADRVLLRSVEIEQWIGTRPPGWFMDALNRVTGEFMASRDMNDDGVPRIHAIAKVSDTDWRVIASLPEQQVIAPVHALATRILSFGLGGILLWLFIARWIARNVEYPVRRLTAAAAAIVAGDKSARAHPSGPKEIAQLAQDFNHMLDQLALQHEKLEALTSRYVSIVQYGREIILLIDERGNFVEANNAALAAYGYDRDEFLSLPLRSLRAPETQASLADHLCAASGLQGALFETVHQRKDGTTFPVEVSSCQVTIDGRVYVESFVRDISERKKAEMLREKLTARLELLSERLSKAQEDERRAIAHELHDQLGQEITTLRLHLAMLGNRSDAIRSEPHFQEAVALADASQERVSGMALNMSPLQLDELGLSEMLHLHCARQAAANNVSIHVDAPELEQRLPQGAERACFRVIQEALTNVLRHAQASEVLVSLRAHEGKLVLGIRDNGTGFDVDAVLEDRNRAGLGLLGMEQRARNIGGSLKIVSAPGAGTSITLAFPMPPSQGVTVDAVQIAARTVPAATRLPAGPLPDISFRDRREPAIE